MMAGITGMAMSLVYPELKLLFEASTRRATVTLTWKEGQKEYSMELMQWITSPQKAAVPPGMDPSEDNPMNPFGQGNTGVTGGTTGGSFGTGAPKR